MGAWRLIDVSVSGISCAQMFAAELDAVVKISERLRERLRFGGRILVHQRVQYQPIVLRA